MSDPSVLLWPNFIDQQSPGGFIDDTYSQLSSFSVMREKLVRPTKSKKRVLKPNPVPKVCVF